MVTITGTVEIVRFAPGLPSFDMIVAAEQADSPREYSLTSAAEAFIDGTSATVSEVIARLTASRARVTLAVVPGDYVEVKKAEFATR
jgi:hypothetical protein